MRLVHVTEYGGTFFHSAFGSESEPAVSKNGDSPQHRNEVLKRVRSVTRIASVFSLACIFGLVSASAYAVNSVEATFPRANDELPQSHPISYANATNAELDALGARWGYLSAAERRALLAEVRRRVAQNNGGSTRVRIQATRQFGVVQRPDGTTIRVERRIIRMIPSEQGYGTGFEQRAARDGNPSGLPATPLEAERRANQIEQGNDTEQSTNRPGYPLQNNDLMPASSSGMQVGQDPISTSD